MLRKQPKIDRLKREKFYKQYFRQNFPFRDSLIRYITKNPSTPEVYQKLTKSCKFFFIENPILVFPELYYNACKNGAYINGHWRDLNFDNITSKYWITNYSGVGDSNPKNENLVPTFIRKIYKCTVKNFNLRNQTLFYRELLFFSSNVESLTLEKVIVKHDDGTLVPMENIVEAFPKVKTLKLISPTVSFETFTKLLKIPQFLALKSFNLDNVSEDFNLEGFCVYMKANKNTEISLHFCDLISNEYKSRLEAVVDEIIGAESHDFIFPYIHFTGINRQKFSKLECMRLKQCNFHCSN